MPDPGLLADPRLRHLPVQAIGARWGMPDPARFNRAFRTAYGTPPAVYRALAEDDLPPGAGGRDPAPST